MKVSVTFLVFNFCLLGNAQILSLFAIADAEAQPNHISLEHLQVEGFLAVSGQFKSAKSAKNETKFAEVIVRIKEIKTEIKQFQVQTRQKLYALQPHNYFDHVSLEIELIAALKVDQALNWIAEEILLYQAGLSPLVNRNYVLEIDTVIKSEELKLSNLSILGKEAQKLLDEGLKQNGTARQHTSELIQHKLNQIILDAQSIQYKIVLQYEVEMLKFNLQENQDLNLIQKLSVARVTSMLSFSANYTKPLKGLISKLLQ